MKYNRCRILTGNISFEFWLKQHRFFFSFFFYIFSISAEEGGEMNLAHAQQQALLMQPHSRDV